MAPLEEINRLNSLVSTINTVLARYNISEKIYLSDITVTENIVSDLAKGHNKLSNLITDLLWPSISSATVYHYTSRDSAEKILNSGVFRLTNIEKRYNEGEIVTFCETHNLTGYIHKDAHGNQKYRELIMPNTFYASFTDTNISNEEEDYFWSIFGGCDGVRLKIDIQASNPDFRKMCYEIKSGVPLQPIYELTELIKNDFGLTLIIKGISRLCSFYLSGDYSQEKEYRALFRTWDGGIVQPTGQGPHSYIEVPLNKMNDCGFQLNITEVHATEKINMPASYLFSKREI